MLLYYIWAPKYKPMKNHRALMDLGKMCRRIVGKRRGARELMDFIDFLGLIGAQYSMVTFPDD